MKLLNCMFGKGRGGLEQAALDYHEALALGGVDVTSVLHEDAAMREVFDTAKAKYATIKPFAEWDSFAAGKLRSMAESADAVIAHGNRAIGIALKACKGRVPVIGVAHNYNIEKRFPKLDGAFCITQDLVNECANLGLSRDCLYQIPNLVRIRNYVSRPQFRDPPVIGTMGRFVEKKGMDIFLQALGGLHARRVSFRAVLGGDGDLSDTLKGVAHLSGLASKVEFPGWVTDKQAFWDSIDIFVLPSHHEPFGIVLIEAMEQGLPCITTDSEGPVEIVTPDKDAVLIPKADPAAMADALAELLGAPDRARAMGEAARATVETRYDIKVVSERLIGALRELTAPKI